MTLPNLIEEASVCFQVYQILPTLLSHSSAGVRAGAVRFAAAAARQLSSAEAYVFLQPKLSPAVNGEPANERKIPLSWLVQENFTGKDSIFGINLA